MSEDAGEKTELPTPKKLEEAFKKGQFARSAEIQTAGVLLGGIGALSFTGAETWKEMVRAMVMTLGHLHDTPISLDTLQAQTIGGLLVFFKCAGPVVLATMITGVLVSAVQNRFNIASEALGIHWEKLNPVTGFSRVFSFRNAVPTLISMVKMGVIMALTYSEVQSILNDPIFSTSVNVGRMSGFLAEVSMRIFLRVSTALLVIAAADYGYQWWRNHKDMMMTKQEVKDEAKSSEGNPQVKAAQRRRKRAKSKAKELAEVATADVVVTNPTHIAIALRYDRKTMKAPKIVAKGIRLNAQKIREMAHRHQIPIMENKPLARMLFKHGRVGGEVPSQLFTAVAEVLAWVYRVNRYRYYMEANKAA